MAENTRIEWADHTFNPWMGCTNVSPACDHCYAEALVDTRWHKVQWGTGKARVRTSPANWVMPLKWEKWHKEFHAKHGRRQRVFCASLADVFDNEAPYAWRCDLFDMIEATPHLDWLLLTKRIGNAMQIQSGLPTRWLANPRPNVWLGATICNQKEADRDIPKLLAVSARVRFLSIEPMLGPITIADISHPGGLLKPLVGIDWRPTRIGGLGAHAAAGCLHWVIAGGESGTHARPAHPDWFRGLRDQCEAAGVPFLFKQWGEWTPGENVERVRGTVDTAFLCDDRWSIHPLNLATDHGHIDDQPDLYRVGKKAAGRRLDGRTWDGVPAP